MLKSGNNFEASLLDPQKASKILYDLDKYDAEASLLEFIKLMWSVLEPGRPFVNSWHIGAICEHLTAITDGEINRLLMNVPPGCMKSLTTQVFWPAWEWGPRNLASHRFVSFSYSKDLTLRDNIKTRRLIESPEYQRFWGDRVKLTSDQNAKVKFENSSTGFKLATSVGGLGTGERGDRVVVDDPHNVQDGESEAVRGNTLQWFQETLPTRVTDPTRSAIAVIMQRIHEEDVSGYIIEAELGYTHLMLPMEFEPDRKCYTSIGFEDPRTEEGELLWPDRMTRAVVERDKKVMGSYATAGQFQQRPAPRGGSMFQREWFEVVPESSVPSGCVDVRGWDLAATEAESAAYTAGVRVKHHRETNIFYIYHATRFRGSPHIVDRALKNTAMQDGPRTKISIPQDPGQAGKSQVKYFAKLLVGHIITFSPESGDKELRAAPFASQAEAGNVKVVRGSWNGDYFDELVMFPKGKFKDQVDATSRAFAELIGRNKRTARPAGPQAIQLRK